MTIEDGRILEVGPVAQGERLSGKALASGFVNDHSHAFQRGLRGAVERIEAFPPPRRLLDLARADVCPGGRSVSRLHKGGQPPLLRGDALRRIHERHRVPLRPPPSRRNNIQRPERPSESGGPGLRRRGHTAPVAACRLRAGAACRDFGISPYGPSWRGSMRSESGRKGVRWSRSASPPTASGRSRENGWRRSGSMRRMISRCISTQTSSCVRSKSVRPSTDYVRSNCSRRPDFSGRTPR